MIAVCVASMLRAEPIATFTATEHLGVDWPRTMVTYRLSAPSAVAVDRHVPGQVILHGAARPGDLRLINAAGDPVPHQLSRVVLDDQGAIRTAWISFFADLPKNSAFQFSLVAGSADTAGRARASRDNDMLVLDNGITAVRVPDGEEAFASPRPLNDTSPSPIMGVRLEDGTWTAPAAFENLGSEPAPVITGWSSQLTAQGPLFAEATITYRFDNGGHYTLTARLIDGEPGVRIDEQMDLRVIRGERDWRVRFPLTDAADRFRPDVAWWATPHGRLHRVDEAFEAAVAARGFPPLTDKSHGNRRHLSSMGFEPGDERKTVVPLAVWYPYHPVAHYVAIARREAVTTSNDRAIPFAAVMTLHAGNWRGIPENYNGELVVEPDGRVGVTWPLTASPHPNSVLHTGEPDPELPYTVIRRQWALIAGALQYHDPLLTFRRYEGYVNLDHYKDWVLDWPVDPAVTHPRLVVTRPQVEQIQARLDHHPMEGQLQQLLCFNDDAARADALMRSLASDNMWSGARGHALRCLGRDADSQRRDGWVAGFRHSQKAAWTHAADEVLSSKHLKPEDRARLRAWIAATCYALSEPDFNPRGSMVHLGNPNMPMNRFFALTFAAALIPDHPEAGNWLNASRDYVRYILSRNTAPGGGWSELLTYYMAGASHTLQAALVLHNQGMLDDTTAKLAMAAGRFPMFLVAPHDPRFAARTLPAWGHEGYWMMPTQWLPVAAIAAGRDPSLASALAWTWDQLGRPITDHHDAAFSPRAIAYADLSADADVPTEALASRWIPGFGATMRAHAGDPHETFLAYRQGYMVSHCDANQGDFLLYARGVPLTVPSIFQYAIYNNSPFQKLYESFGWHNRVRFGSPDNTGGWPGGGIISQVHRFAASDTADYLRGVGHYDASQWTRQLMLLKSPSPTGPSYFVMHDSFGRLTDAPMSPTWWYLRTDGPTSRIEQRETGFTYASPQGPSFDVTFLSPSTVALTSREATQRGPLFNRAAELWKQAGGDIEGTQTSQTMTVTAAGPIAAGQDITVLLVPRGEGDPPPRHRVVAPGVTEIITSDGADVVFLSDEPFEYADDRVRFRGRGGAVRIRNDEIHLIVSEGPGMVGFEDVSLTSAVAATRVLRRDALAGQQIEHQAAPHAINLDAVPAGADVQTPQPGVTHWRTGQRTGWVFDASEVLKFDADPVRFHGRKGSIVRYDDTGVTRLTLIEGERIGHANHVVWGGDGPYTVTFHTDRITGRVAGPQRFVYLTRPAGLLQLPTMVVDGVPFMPGLAADLRRRDIATTGDPFDAGADGTTLIVPAMGGEHDFVIRALEQPAVFRHWQAWPDVRP